jgi:hypothetical protein
MTLFETDAQQAGGPIRKSATRRSAVAFATIVLSVAILVPPTVALGTGGAPPKGVRSLAVNAPVNDGLPNRWFGVLEYLIILRQSDATSTTRTYSKATFTLSQVLRQGPGENYTHTYVYRARGTLRASYLLAGANGCQIRGSGTVPLDPTNGGFEIIVWKPRGKPAQFTYGLLPASDTKPPEITVRWIGCDVPPRPVPTPISWPLIRNFSKTTARAGVLRGNWIYPPPAEGFRTWCLARRQGDLDTCKSDELEAVARVSGSTRRAAPRTLDGSASKGHVKAYEWSFDPVSCTSTRPGACAGYCRAAGPKPGAAKTGVRVAVKPLCTIRATLTVTDGQDDDSDSVLVSVTPRVGPDWKTPVSYRETRDSMTVPWVRCDTSTGACKLELDGGMNIPDPMTCPGQPKPGSQIVCPLLGSRSSWSGSGYTLATISDPKGPFDGYSYVGSSSLAVNELGILNRYLFPEAPTEIDGNNFYSYNKSLGTDVDGFLKALSQHEGFGAPGKPHTGHAQTTRDDLAKPENDPRREIEQLFGPNPTSLQESADRRIKEIDDSLQSDTCDKGPGCTRLDEIGRFGLYFFHPSPTGWTWDKATITVT